MAAETLQKIMSAALDMKNMLTNIGVPETKVPQAKTPPIPDFNIPQAKPLREALLKLKVCKETVNKLNQPYISRVNEHRSETIRTLQLLWGRLHEEGAYSPSRAWEKVLLLAQRKTQETLDDLFNMVVSLARNHVTNLATKKRKSQPVFDQRIIDFLLWYFANPKGGQNPGQDEKKKLAVRTGLTYKQIDIWFQNRRARTKKKMAKGGIVDLQEALGNPKRPDFANLPDPMRETLYKKKQSLKETKKLNKRIERLKQKRASEPKRVKIELTRSLIREENDPPLNWLCPRAEGEKATRHKFKSGTLKGIDSWSAPAYAYPAEWNEGMRDAWWQVDIPCASEFEHKSTPHPEEPKDVTVTDEEMDALEKQFAGLKIEVLQKIYWHQYPDGRLEAIHPKLVRVRKDGTFFMYDDEELHEGSPTTLPPRPTRPRRGDSANRPIIVDQPGTSVNDPITIQDPGSSAQEPIVLDIPGATAADPIFVGLPGTSVSDAIVVDVPGTSPADPIVVHYPGISISDPIVVDVPGASASDPIVVDTKGAPSGSSGLPRAINPIVVVNIPEATEEDMGLAACAEVKEASKGKGRMLSHESTPESDSGSSRASTSPGTGFSPFNGSFAISSPSLPVIGNDIFANGPDILGTQLGSQPVFYPYPYNEIQSSLPPDIFDVLAPGSLPGDLSILDPFAMSATTGIPTDCLLVNSAPPQVPVVDPVQTQRRRTLEEEFAEIFKGIDVHNPQVQFSPQGEIDWDALLAPPTVATVYQSIPEVPGSASVLPAPVPQAQIVVEPQLDLLTQMQTGQFDTWEALYGDTYPELPRIEDIPPPSAWEGAFDPTLQEFFDRLWASEAATSAGAAPTADSFSTFVTLPSQGFDTFKL